MNEQQPKSSAAALLPLLAFLCIFIGAGVYLTMTGTDMAFYQLSATVAILPAIALALMQGKERLNKKISIFLSGVGEINIMTMCMIFLLAGGFASVAKSIGAVSATVNFGLSFAPSQCILPGLFVIAAFVSTAMGTSMGTVAAITPIALGVAGQTSIPLPLIMGVVLGGAMFGDNLSMISDTTIASTRTQGCDMGDKFRMNLLIALPAALAVILLLWISGTSGTDVTVQDYNVILVIPYLSVIVLALLGINVFVVLAVGIVLSGFIGLACTPGYTWLKWGQDIYAGFTGMHEIFVLSMLIGGLGELIKYRGGIAWILERIEALSARLAQGKSTRAGECCIAMLVALADICTANNTVAIILTGGMAKEIAGKHGIDPRRSASVLDTVSCIMQGLLPYAAQLLLAGSMAKLSPMSIAANNWYCMLLAVAVLGSIIVGRPGAPRR